MMGSRVGPPTRITASRSAAVMRALCRASSQTLKVRCTRSITILLNSASVSVPSRSIPLPVGSWQIPSMWIFATASLPTSIFARSLASLSICRQYLLSRRSIPSLEEVVGEPGHDAVVEVIAAEVGVAGGGEHLEDVLAD